MDKHGSESYFVIGEGLLAESVGGRDAATIRTLASAAAAPAPPFRFSRMGPKGRGRQLAEPTRRKLASAMIGPAAERRPSRLASPTWASSSTTTSPSTRPHTLDENVTPALLVQARSPSLDLDSLTAPVRRNLDRPSSTRPTAST